MCSWILNKNVCYVKITFRKLCHAYPVALSSHWRIAIYLGIAVRGAYSLILKVLAKVKIQMREFISLLWTPASSGHQTWQIIISPPAML